MTSSFHFRDKNTATTTTTKTFDFMASLFTPTFHSLVTTVSLSLFPFSLHEGSRLTETKLSAHRRFYRRKNSNGGVFDEAISQT
jgi:hypothetical protein